LKSLQLLLQGGSFRPIAVLLAPRRPGLRASTFISSAQLTMEESQFDAVILGTGLVNSITAAYVYQLLIWHLLDFLI
jgi:hypothetical protein